jgi:hypothetical protein
MIFDLAGEAGANWRRPRLKPLEILCPFVELLSDFQDLFGRVIRCKAGGDARETRQTATRRRGIERNSSLSLPPNAST